MLYEMESDEKFEIWEGKKHLMTPGGTDHEYILSNLNWLPGLNMNRAFFIVSERLTTLRC